jgi:zona occludens toxin
MLTLLSATPGSGKTLKCIELIYDALNRGHVVYSNILGLLVPGVIKIDTDTDWRDLDGFKRTMPGTDHLPISVFYDEAHEHQGFCDPALITLTDKQKIKDVQDIGRSLSMHRHFGFDIYLITQHPSKLAKFVITDVGRHLFLRRFFNMERATIYEFPEAHVYVNKSVRSDALNKTIWKFPKHLYGSYTSTETNTHKTNIPKKYIYMLAIFLFFVLYILYRIYGMSFFNNDNPQKTDPTLSTTQQVKLDIPSPTEKNNLKTNDQSLDKEYDRELTRVAMVIESSTDCYAKNTFGEYIDMSVDACRTLSKNNKRMSMSRVKQDFSHLSTDYSTSSGTDQNYNGFSTKPIS